MMGNYIINLPESLEHRTIALAKRRGITPEKLLTTAVAAYTTLSDSLVIPHATAISASALAQRLDAGWSAPIIDVDEPSEFRQMRLPKSVNIPVFDLWSHLSEIPQAGDLLFVCKAGIRSMFAAGLFGADHPQVFYLEGGLLQWQTEGRALDADQH